jgi:hypothetical protein
MDEGQVPEFDTVLNLYDKEDSLKRILYSGPFVTTRTSSGWIFFIYRPKM